MSLIDQLVRLEALRAELVRDEGTLAIAVVRLPEERRLMAIERTYRALGALSRSSRGRPPRRS